MQMHSLYPISTPRLPLPQASENFPDTLRGRRCFHPHSETQLGAFCVVKVAGQGSWGSGCILLCFPVFPNSALPVICTFPPPSFFQKIPGEYGFCSIAHIIPRAGNENYFLSQPLAGCLSHPGSVMG